MKKLIALVLAVMLLVPAFAMAEDVIKIGVYLDLYPACHEPRLSHRAHARVCRAALSLRR